MNPVHTSSRLRVPGATLYYERRGAGPLLLLIPGGPQDAGVFAGIAVRLAERYTVVAYDPRGNSRSRWEGAPAGLDVGVQAEDAAALIGALGLGAALVFGTSGGAHIALELASRYPERVRAVVAHEPPTALALEDPAPALAADQELYDTYRRAGVEAAMQQFFAGNGLDDVASGELELPPDVAATMARVQGNFEYWLAHGLLPLSCYRPDVAALRDGAPRIIVGLGRESAGQPIHAMGSALAAQLGSAPVEFPGDHLGFESHAELFAATLRRLFAGASA